MITSLPNCVRDARAQKDIAERFGFKASILENEDATTDRVVNMIAAAASNLKNGDLFFISFSGHGNRVIDKDGDEEDGYDETWCLYDQMLIDDDIFELLKRFKPGVRILIIADSCHSGTSIRNLGSDEVSINGEGLSKRINEMQAAGLLMAACQDNQTALGGEGNSYSVYTNCMLNVLEQCDCCESYWDLHQKISSKMPITSTPNLFLLGPGAEAFAGERPFRI